MLKVRKLNTIYRIPIVYGNYAVQIAQAENAQEPERHTHRWTLYVRGVNGEDISYYIKKIEFKLHESFDEPIRTISSPPYEVTETGWGEFSTSMRLFFIDSSEKPVVLTHNLALFDHKDLPNTLKVEPYKEGVKSEYYDELIFQDATTEMAKILEENHSKSIPIHENVDCFYTKELEEQLMLEFDDLEAEILAELEGK
eukprot:NODE_93_length_21581_cov_0.291919.p8 type:complete len:198 gc:universal NODE_93_length_21581_cov_0.291919:13301-13894(+)